MKKNRQQLYIEKRILETLQDSDQARNMTITWINHASLLKLAPNLESLNDFTHVGVDGYFLKTLIGRKIERSSADLVLPHVLREFACNVILAGGFKNQLEARAQTFMALFPKSKILLNIDGYRSDIFEIIDSQYKLGMVNLIIVGLGAVRQEEIALKCGASTVNSKSVVIATCGGWLDQITVRNYYPSWAYPLKLNWLVRLIREPKRLWKRYTVDAIRVFRYLEVIKKFGSQSNMITNLSYFPVKRDSKK